MTAINHALPSPGHLGDQCLGTVTAVKDIVKPRDFTDILVLRHDPRRGQVPRTCPQGSPDAVESGYLPRGIGLNVAGLKIGATRSVGIRMSVMRRSSYIDGIAGPGALRSPQLFRRLGHIRVAGLAGSLERAIAGSAVLKYAF